VAGHKFNFGPAQNVNDLMAVLIFGSITPKATLENIVHLPSREGARAGYVHTLSLYSGGSGSDPGCGLEWEVGWTGVETWSHHVPESVDAIGCSVEAIQRTGRLIWVQST
jgi:hypothetical protein